MAAPSTRRGRPSWWSAAAVWPTLVILLVVLSQSAPPMASAQSASNGLTSQQRSAISIDSTLLEATVPSRSYVGENFSVTVRVTNASNESLPLLVELAAPVNMLYISPLLVHELIQPEGVLSQTFWVIPIQQNSGGAINVTAKVWIWFTNNMSTPALVAHSTAFVYFVGPSPSAPWAAAGIGALVVAVVAVFFFVRRRSRRRPRVVLPPPPAPSVP